MFLETQLRYSLFPYSQRGRRMEMVNTDILSQVGSVEQPEQSSAMTVHCAWDLLHPPHFSNHAGLSADPCSYWLVRLAATLVSAVMNKTTLKEGFWTERGTRDSGYSHLGFAVLEGLGVDPGDRYWDVITGYCKMQRAAVKFPLAEAALREPKRACAGFVV